MKNQNNKKPNDKQKRDSKVTGQASREEINNAFDKLDKEALDAVVKNVQAELDKREKLEKLPPKPDYDKKFADTAVEATQKGRIAKIYVPNGKRFARNMRSAAEIAKVICGLWGKPGDKVEILNKKHGYHSDGANVSISIRGEGDICIHPSPDLTSGIVTRGELMMRLGYAYGNIAAETTKQTEPGPKASELEARSLGEHIQNLKTKKAFEAQEMPKMVCTVGGFGFVIDSPNVQDRIALRFKIWDKLTGNKDNKPIPNSALSDDPKTPVHLTISGEPGNWNLFQANGAGIGHCKTEEEVAFTVFWKFIEHTSAKPENAPAKPSSSPKKAVLVIGTTPNAKARANALLSALLAKGYIVETVESATVDPAVKPEDLKISLYDHSSTYVHHPHKLHKIWRLEELVKAIQELDEKHAPTKVDPKVVKTAETSGIPAEGPLTTKKAEEPKPVDIFALPKSRYVSLVHQYCTMDDELVKQFQREIYEATGEMPDDFSLNMRCHSDTIVTVGVLDNRIASVFEPKNPNMLKSSEHKVYFNEVAGKVKEILDASGVPYAKAKKPEPVDEEPTRQYVYMKKRRGLPDGEAYSECVPVAMSKNQKLRIVKLAQEKHKAVGALMRETVVSALKID